VEKSNRAQHHLLNFGEGKACWPSFMNDSATCLSARFTQ
jgi:hypothetical protein